ncbi:elongation factor-like GTPase 1 isoform X2 [Hermetia illucens]|uniref:elongation factor-like GTPase 1 isoform X2 n=1 Tax=Hermetia illucens TaxID=343691 RepID=UPI0018CC512F|nr:elongation factor-like GTPase 1 isoform X2 [Hermetia illucens]
MSGLSIEKVVQLQHDVASVRNICILAHVDHGKTTLADSLVAVTGIISQRLAGKLRYLDCRADEQERGITLKSSSITLHYTKANSNKDYLVNLIDTPGHVDFSSEVSTAVRLCDGAVVVVDAVEGVCPQTRACLEQLYKEHLKPILVVNKIDRLILEKKMEPLDAYIHLTQLLEQVNAVVGNIFASDVMAKEDLTEEGNYTSALEFTDDSTLYFSPEMENVLFCSAADGWAFSVRKFANIYKDKLNMSSDELTKVLWGDYYYSTKKKCSVSGAQEQAKKPMFVQFVLENIWNLYDLICIRKDKDKIPDIASKLGITLTIRDLRSTDPKSQIRALFSQWLPIHVAVLEMVIDSVPGPKNMSGERAEKLLCSANLDFSSYPKETQKLKSDFISCDPNNSNVVAFISKMVPIDKSRLPQNKPKPLTAEEIQQRRELIKQRIEERKRVAEQQDITTGMENLSTKDETKPVDDNEVKPKEDEIDQEFIAFARIFSGTLKPGMKLYVLSPKHDPRKENLNPIDSPHIIEVNIGNLYLFMGGELESLSEVPAGNIVGIGGLQDVVLKSATLANNIYCPSFSELSLMATPILKVALEPVNIFEMPKLLSGLKLLNQADACVQVSIQESGEHTITTLGEVHLEKCVKDLEETYAKIKLHVSAPIVSFRETIVPEATIDMVNEAIVKTDNDITKKIVSIQTANKLGSIRILALPLSDSAINALDQHLEVLKTLSMVSKVNPFPEKFMSPLKQLKNGLSKELEKLELGQFSDCLNLAEKVWSVGPKKCGSNILLNLTDYKHQNFWKTNPNEDDLNFNIDDIRNDYNSSFINGFQLASSAGPLCEEPMQGVAFVILEWRVDESDELNSKVFGPFSGQVMSSVKEGCRKAFQAQPQRLVTPMYTCNIVVNSEVLGKMYAVIARRHGRILSSDLTQGSDNFAVTAVLPVIESFNFVQEIRKQTSGLACPQLIFSHWEVIDIDPFWIPSTEEEYLHFGEKADSANRAKKYMDSVRKRKGLAVEEKIVEHAEKQRTLSKNK